MPEKILTGCICFVSLIIFVTALLCPPNTWDSMTYHMPRVLHWLQNGSAGIYPTAIDRQLWAGPLAEYFVLVLHFLSGSDRFANMVQFFSMAGCLWGLTLIAKELGANRLTRLFTVLLAATIPMGIVQASSTQNDYVVSLWMVFFVYYLFKASAVWRFQYLLAAGFCLGLGILTKGTGYIYGLAFLLAWILFERKKFNFQRFLQAVSILAAMVLVTNAYHYAQNYRLGADFIRPAPAAQSVENQTKSPAVLISNIMRNISLHAASPVHPVNKMVEQAIIGAHGLMGFDVNDQRTTMGSFRVHQHISEDETNNLRHFLLFLLAVIIFLKRKDLKGEPKLWVLFIGSVFSFVLYSWFLKWQSTGTRLQLAMFVLSAPFVAVTLAKAVNWKLIAALGIVFVLCSFPWLFKNPAKRWVSSHKPTIFNTSREEMYFAHRRDYYTPYKVAALLLAQSECRNLGLVMGEDSWEYPLWALLPQFGKKYRIEHLYNEQFLHKEYPLGPFQPCAIFSDNPNSAEEVVYGQTTFKRVYREQDISLFFAQ